MTKLSLRRLITVHRLIDQGVFYQFVTALVILNFENSLV